MKNLLFILLVLSPILVTAQSQDQNYILSSVYTEPSTVVAQPTKITTVTYYDGIGRPIQSVAAKAGGLGQDIVTHISYDGFGRQAQQYLPYVLASTTTSNLNIRDVLSLPGWTKNVYLAKYPGELLTGSNANPYSESLYEPGSPLNRVLEQAAPGKDWKGNPVSDADHTVKYDYQTNKTSEVRRFNVKFIDGNTENTELTTNGYYTAGRLYKTITKDENWTINDGKNKTKEEFKDKDGRLILKRTYENGNKHDTYYVYDRFGNLTYVIPPMASDDVVIQTAFVGGVGINYPWPKLYYVSQQIVEDFDLVTSSIPNDEILNVNLMDQYGAAGGFSLVPDDNGNLTLNINMTAATPMKYRTGIIADLKNIGTFSDRELGRLSGSGYEYIFVIRGNMLEVTGNGSVPSLVATLNGNTPLEYGKNYPWTKLCIGDSQVLRNYEDDIKALANDQILNIYTANPYGASGGVAVSVDEFDNVTISVNITNTVGLELVSGVAFPLETERRLDDRLLGTVSGEINGTPYNYEFSIKDNSLHISGKGKFYTLNHFSSQFSRPVYEIRNTVVDGLCYIYHYDKRDRIVEKHIPGAGWTHIVYDRLDRPVLTQDENQRPDKIWMFIKYEEYGRIAYTGMHTFTGTDPLAIDRLELQAILNNTTTTSVLWETRMADVFTNGTNAIDYTNFSYPTTNFDVYTVNYYDTYGFRRSGITVPPALIYDTTPTTNTKGLATGSDIRILGTDTWTISINGYDEKARPIYTFFDNDYLLYTHVTETNLDFDGAVVEAKNVHTKDGQAAISLFDNFYYDQVRRQVKHIQKVGAAGTPQLLSWSKYNEFGQIDEKKVGGTNITTYSTAGLQDIDYTYNVRGWITKINDPSAASMGTDLWAFKINYNTTEITGSTALYNGNISETHYKSLSDNILRKYSYRYDALNRLTNAIYTGNGAENYNEGDITYDKNGNIKNLSRWGYNGTTWLKIDQLTYTYAQYSNKLMSVSDTEGSFGFDNSTTGTNIDYSYDLNGNLKKDLNKGLGTVTADETSYNHMNLPVMIKKDATHKLEFVYDATGKKLQKKYTNGTNVTTTQYFDDGFVYEKANAGANTLQFFPHVEGYAKKNGSTFSYIYHYKDHLGNVRMSYWKNGGVTEIIEQDNYYAYGLKHEGYNFAYLSTGNARARLLKFNGKELNPELNLGMYDYGARNYDPAIGRWFNIDPLAETSRRYSPYAYALDNPVYFIDPDGMQAEGAAVEGAAKVEAVTSSDFNVNIGQGIKRSAASVGASMSTTGFELNQKGQEKITNNAKYYLEQQGYDPDENIENEEHKNSYMWNMRQSVLPLDMLYDDAGDPKIEFQYIIPGAKADYSVETKTVRVSQSVFTTNLNLFFHLMHEGTHAWDHHHGLLNFYGGWFDRQNWGDYGKLRSMTEVRAYQMMVWFGYKLEDFEEKLVKSYTPIANENFINYQIKSYPVFFHNISNRKK